MFLMQQSYVQMLIIWFHQKKTEDKDFASLTQIFKLLVYTPNIFETYIMVT